MPMIKQKTRIIMDSGDKYEFHIHPEDFLAKIVNQMGILFNGFVHLKGLSINPQHISAIETIEYTE